MNLNTIWKFPFSLSDKVTISIPENSKIIRVDTQGNTPVMWGICDPDKNMVLREFKIVGTGMDFDSSYSYVGTFFDGPFVWHVLENTEIIQQS